MTEIGGVMSHTVKIQDQLTNSILEQLNIPVSDLDQQVNKLAEIGLKVVIANDNDLSDIDLMADQLWEPSKTEQAFFAERIKKGQGVGLDENDNLVYQRDLNSQQG